MVFYEDKMMYKLKGPVPEGDYTIPLGVAEVKRPGEDLTIVATSSMVQVALGAAKLLEEYDISAEVVDPRTLWPLDEQTLIESARKTSRAMVIDEGYERYGVGGGTGHRDSSRRVLRFGSSGEAHRRDARADSVLAAAGRRDGADGSVGVRGRDGALRQNSEVDAAIFSQLGAAVDMIENAIRASKPFQFG